MKSTRLIQLATFFVFTLLTGLSLAHPGSLDINGGHYFGPSYHCHMPACQMPDTFSVGRSRRDGVMTNYRNREDSLMRMTGPMRKTSTRTASLPGRRC